jgi:hypothetical protein
LPFILSYRQASPDKEAGLAVRAEGGKTMWYKCSLLALLGLFTTASAQAQLPYYPPARNYPRGRVQYPDGPPYALPPRYDRYPGGYSQPLPQQDPRQAWSYIADTGGTFQHTSGNQWVQYRNGQSPLNYVEVGRTPEYVEIYDPIRNLHVRLYPTQLWQTNPDGSWLHAFDGQWS